MCPAKESGVKGPTTSSLHALKGQDANVGWSSFGGW